jgi:hypothetical protein
MKFTGIMLTMARFRLVRSTPIQTFLGGLLLGFSWGVLSVLFGQFVLKVPEAIGDSHSPVFPMWMFVKYVIPVGMAFGVAFSSLHFLHNAQLPDTFLSVKQVLKHYLMSLSLGFVCTLLAESVLLLGLAIVYTRNSEGIFIIFFGMVFSTPAVLITLILVGLLIQPLISLIWDKWSQI